MMPDAHYIDPKLAALYDLGSGWSEDRDFYLSLAGSHRQEILDLGCGTGLLCHAYAEQGHRVTGVDPAPAMLNLARQKSDNPAIGWVEGSVQEFRSPKRYDLIIMTGHAFQVLLTDNDVRAGLDTMHRHLKPDGKVVFESRNPKIDWAGRWSARGIWKTPEGPVKAERRLVSFDGDIMTFDWHYQFTDDARVSRSELRFLSHERIAEFAEAAQLRVSSIVGDWSGAPFDADRSEEMIFELRLTE